MPAGRRDSPLSDLTFYSLNHQRHSATQGSSSGLIPTTQAVPSLQISATGHSPQSSNSTETSSRRGTTTYLVTNGDPVATDLLETDVELQDCLTTYRTRMVPLFPIVPIDESMTVTLITQTYPFLFLVIRGICCKNTLRQKAIGIEIRKVLGEELIMEGTRSLDLLIGLLVLSG